MGADPGRRVLLGLGLATAGVVLLLPLAVVLVEAASLGVAGYAEALVEPDTRAAMGLTCLVALVSVAAATLFGGVAAWCIARFRFRGRDVLLTVIDLPFSVSPVIAGLVQVLLFGRRGWLGPWLAAHDIQVVFALPGIILATLFVTLPFVARELIPLMEAQGAEEEEAALLLGASVPTMLWRVTLPNIKWGLLTGVLLCNARAMGEFGAVSVVSGHIRGATNTLPLHVEVLFNDFQIAAAFAVASLLAMPAIVTLGLKFILERRPHGAHRSPA